jgi:hypothetical protein
MERTAAYQAQMKHPGLAMTEARISVLRDRVQAPSAEA